MAYYVTSINGHRATDMTRDNQPSYWIESHYDEEVYDKIDAMYFDGELDQMDAGDVVALAINLQKEVDAEAEIYAIDSIDAEIERTAKFIKQHQGKPMRKVQAATRLTLWITKKLQLAVEDGDMDAIDHYAKALQLNAYTANLRANAL